MSSPRGAEEMLLGFTRALRSAGLPVTPDRSQGFLEAVAEVDLADRRATYAAGRATLCGSPDDLARYDRVFTAWFGGEPLPTGQQQRPAATPQAQLQLAEDGDGTGHGDGDVVQAAASEVEVLQHRDVSTLSAGERQRLAALFATLHPRAPLRRAARHERWHRGRIDASRTLRSSLRRMGEPAAIQWRRRGTRPRRVVLLVDVSGSMSGYADALLRFAHRATRSSLGRGAASGRTGVETFTLGTRLTHVTRAMRVRDPEQALAAAGTLVPDWSGGTRLGETLQAFVDRWGRRGMARGAVVVIFSDGWERGDPTLLAEQVERLHRLAHRVIWVNPHRGKAGYQPLQAGVQAVLPHVDAFLAGHSWATYAALSKEIADA